MTLTLRAVSLNDLPLTQPITAHFDTGGGTIGRSDQNTMALPDPERHISRCQAAIERDASGGGYLIRNVGSANPIVVRDQSLGKGESAMLLHHDQVRIGGYLLEVIDESPGDNDATTITRGRAAVAAQPQARLPDDFDPFAMPSAMPAFGMAPPAPSSAPAGSFADLIPSAAPASIDEMFGLGRAESADPLAAFVASAQQAQSDAQPALPTDPLKLFGERPPAASEPVTPVANASLLDHTHELRAAFEPPRMSAIRPEPVAVTAPPAPPEVPIAPTVAPAAALPPWTGETAELWAAFCEGAGLRLAPPQGLNPDLMRVIGSMLRAAVTGTVQLMAVRSATRHELRAQVTVIQPRNNNPLKFSPDAQAAMEQLLQPPLRGFLPGPAAMADAMNDLVSHAIGTMAGTRAALDGVLARFAPSQLEAKLVGQTMWDILPMNRKSRLWELYLQHFEGIREEAQEDFHTLFGKAFLSAYEQQLERLRRDREGAAEPASTSPTAAA